MPPAEGTIFVFYLHFIYDLKDSTLTENVHVNITNEYPQNTFKIL